MAARRPQPELVGRLNEPVVFETEAEVSEVRMRAVGAGVAQRRRRHDILDAVRDAVRAAAPLDAACHGGRLASAVAGRPEPAVEEARGECRQPGARPHQVGGRVDELAADGERRARLRVRVAGQQLCGDR